MSIKVRFRSGERVRLPLTGATIILVLRTTLVAAVMFLALASISLVGLSITLQGWVIAAAASAVSIVAWLLAARQERKETSDELPEASEERQADALLKGLAFEFRTSLNGIIAGAELLYREPQGERSQAFIRSILESSETLLQTLNDTLDLSDAQAGRLELRPQPTPLRALMDDVQRMWSPRASQDNVTLLTSFDGETEMAVMVDPARLKQVFSGLIGYAMARGRTGVVEVALRAIEDKSRVRLEGWVRDSGPPLASGTIDLIFEPFAVGAAGLSLPACRQILAQMGGRIWAENNVGRGATLGFELQAKRAKTAARADMPGGAAPDAPRAHILVVDDNATNRVVAQALCEMFGCTSDTAEDGLQAVAAVRSGGFDLVLMDIKMPRMDGVAATRAIRSLEGPVRHIPIIALTANADKEDAAKFLDAGMAAVVEKPIKPERLRTAMSAALEERSQAEFLKRA